ncbi:hypothetical protein ABEX29_28575 [Brevibacillus porteri]|uniref:hypothetical protein n=1 Tax=Brevibacillus porteri TaxID=2126350 RepID=UPI003D263243
MDDIKKVIEKILKYWILFPVVIYLVGFIYVQGLLTFITSKFLTLDPFGITASTEIYIKNGISFLVFLSIPIVLSIIIFDGRKSKLKLKKYKVGHIICLIISQIIGWAIHFGVSAITRDNVISVKTYEMFNLIYSEIYYTVTLSIFINGFYIIAVLSKDEKIAGFINNNQDHKEFKKSKTSHYVYHALLMTFSLIGSIYLSGIFKQDKLIQSAFNNSGEKITYADVVTEDISNRYLYFDIVNNYFIGFDLDYNNNSSPSVIIPLTKVKKIDIVELSAPLKVKALSKEQDVLARKKVIEDYYASYKQKDANVFLNTISRKMYREHPYMLIPSEELKKIWDQNKNISSYVPRYFQVFEGIENTEPLLYVIEYHNSKNRYLEYKFIYENGGFKIDKISEVKQWFIIQE